MWKMFDINIRNNGGVGKVEQDSEWIDNVIKDVLIKSVANIQNNNTINNNNTSINNNNNNTNSLFYLYLFNFNIKYYT